MLTLPNCDMCGRFVRPGTPGASWVHVPDTDIPGEFGDERERCVRCTQKHGPAECSPKYVKHLCCGIYQSADAQRAEG